MTPPIELRQRSTKGAPYRTPLGVLGSGIAPPVTQVWVGTFQSLQADFGENGTPDQLVCDSNKDFRAGFSVWRARWIRTSPVGTPTIQDWLANIDGRYYQGATSGNIYRAGGDPANVWCTRGTLERIWTASYASGTEWLSVAWVAFFNAFFEEVDYPTPFAPVGWVAGEQLNEVPPP